jgi:uncharacterized protein
MDKALQTALITGPTSGIGKALAQQLAQLGYNLMLVSRSEDTLAEMCKELKEEYGVEAQYIAADLSKPGEPEKVFESADARGFELDVLVNNAGTQVYAPFADADWEGTQTLIDLNVKALVRLTHLFLPGMIQREQGHILNIGSTASFVPGPNNAVYCAGKAFILSFSAAIAEELRGTGVGVTCLCPGVVDTPFVDQAGLNDAILTKLTAMDPEPVAAAGIRAMQKGKWVHIPGWINKVYIFLSRFAPRRLLTRLSKWALLPPRYR